MNQPSLFEPVTVEAKRIESPLGEQWGMFTLPDLLGMMRLHGMIVVRKDWLTEGMAIEDCEVAETIADGEQQ